ncbi:MAG: glycoside hydrolase family 3 N-terminal domain-containing protein [Acidimicrobiales bacterium]
MSQWSEARLAATTVGVPVEETDPAAVGAEVAAGAGGVILFGSSAPQDLASQIAQLADSVPGRIGLLVMTDEEGGEIQRMSNLVGDLPWPAYMGANWSTSYITSQLAAVGKKMAAAGVNMDLAPVVDVDGTAVVPDAADPDGYRSFSGTTSVVAADGVAFMQGLEQGGVTPVLKHFPGLGGASGNTDDGPAHTLPWSTLQQDAIPPYAQAIAAGAPAVMVSNATVPGLSPVLPASLSSVVIETELVGALHFHGLVITDSLSAGAISGAGFSVSAAAAKAVEAGADMIIYGLSSTDQQTEQQFQDIVTAEVAAVASGALPRGRLLEAATAVLAARHANVCR